MNIDIHMLKPQNASYPLRNKLLAGPANARAL